MTLPPEKIGDKGQRFEVRSVGYPEPDESIVGWAGSQKGANIMVTAIKLHPCCQSAWVVDRGK